MTHDFIRTMYTCSTCLAHDPDFSVYDSIERLKAACSCWEECGIVEIEVKGIKDITLCNILGIK
jgi:hypothetical protein